MLFAAFLSQLRVRELARSLLLLSCSSLFLLLGGEGRIVTAAIATFGLVKLAARGCILQA